MTQSKFAALKASATPTLDFYGNDDPVCPHCGMRVNPSRHDLLDLYKEGGHDIECPYCEQEFRVVTSVSFTFSTDEQEMDEP